MPSQIKIFSRLLPELPVSRIYSRLGHNVFLTAMTDEDREEYKNIISEAVDFLDMKGTAAIFPLKRIEQGEIIIEGVGKARSSKLISYLDGSDSVLLSSVTSGSLPAAKISEAQKSGHMHKAVIYDAVASEYTDAGLDWINEYYNRQLSRNSLRIDKMRYSPGYGDLSLSFQKNIFDALNLSGLGISLTDSMMLLPEKSVTALSAVRTSLNETHQ